MKLFISQGLLYQGTVFWCKKGIEMKHFSQLFDEIKIFIELKKISTWSQGLVFMDEKCINNLIKCS